MSPLANWCLIALGGGLALWLGTIALAYREGRRLGLHARSLEFGRLPAELRLHGTDWSVHLTDFSSGRAQPLEGQLRFEQYDSRVFAEGSDPQGRQWTAEGVVFQDKLCCTLLDEVDSGRQLGTVMVDRCETDGTLSGMRCVWSREQNAVAVQPILLRPRTESSAPHPALTSGNAC